MSSVRAADDGKGYVGVLALVKGRERWTVMYDDTPAGRRLALRQLGRWAAHPELAFNWTDAATLAGKVRGGL